MTSDVRNDLMQGLFEFGRVDPSQLCMRAVKRVLRDGIDAFSTHSNSPHRIGLEIEFGVAIVGLTQPIPEDAYEHASAACEVAGSAN